MNNLLLVLIVGVLGGLIHDVIFGGFTGPELDKSGKAVVLKLGSIGDWVLGAGAAFVTYATTYATAATAATDIQLAFLAFTSGIGGSAILKAYVNGKAASENETKVKAAQAFALSYTGKDVRSLTAASAAPADESERMAKFLEILK
jgi:hypothetical protein